MLLWISSLSPDRRIRIAPLSNAARIGLLYPNPPATGENLPDWPQKQGRIRAEVP
jgi:hypothetical protein